MPKTYLNEKKLKRQTPYKKGSLAFLPLLFSKKSKKNGEKDLTPPSGIVRLVKRWIKESPPGTGNQPRT
jgi:hypothetical protein